MSFRHRNWRYAEILAETLLVLALCNDLAQFLLRLTFPSLREIRTDIRAEMSRFESLLWITTKPDYCFWLWKAAAWIPVNVTCLVPTGVSPLTFLPEKADYLLPARLITASIALPTAALWILLIYSIFVNINTWPVQFAPTSMLTARFTAIWHYIFAVPLLILYGASVCLPPLLIVKVTIWLSTTVFGESAILWASSGALTGLILYCVLNLCGIIRIPSRIRIFYKYYLSDRKNGSQPVDRSELWNCCCCRSATPRIIVLAVFVMLVVVFHSHFPNDVVARAFDAVFPARSLKTSAHAALVANDSSTNVSTASPPIMLRERIARMSYWVDLRSAYDNVTYLDLFANGSNNLTAGARAMGTIGFIYSGIFASIIFILMLLIEFAAVLVMLVMLGRWMWSCLSSSTQTAATPTIVTQKRGCNAGAFFRNMLYLYGITFVLTEVLSFGVPMCLGFLVPERMYMPCYVIITLVGIIGSTCWLLCLCVRGHGKTWKEDVENGGAEVMEIEPEKCKLKSTPPMASNKVY